MIKNLFVLLVTLLCTFGLFAQNLTKEEKKALKEQIKLFKQDPIQLKYLQESVEVKDAIIEGQTTEIIELKKETQQQKVALNTVRDSVELLSTELEETASDSKTEEGFHYRIQIGLYRDFDFTQYLNDPKFIIFEKIGKLFRYSVGNFDKLATAEYFAEELRKMGIKGAFVSEYMDGKRINADKPAGSSEAEKSATEEEVKTPAVNDPYFTE